MLNPTQKQVISRTDCKVGTGSVAEYETNPKIKLTWSPVGELSPVREPPVKEWLSPGRTVLPVPVSSDTSPLPDLSPLKSGPGEVPDDTGTVCTVWS